MFENYRDFFNFFFKISVIEYREIIRSCDGLMVRDSDLNAEGAGFKSDSWHDFVRSLLLSRRNFSSEYTH